MIHGEAESGDHIVERDALSALLEIVLRGSKRLAVFVCQIICLTVFQHYFKQVAHRTELGRGQQVDQRVSLPSFLLEIECHGCTPTQVYRGAMGAGG